MGTVSRQRSLSLRLYRPGNGDDVHGPEPYSKPFDHAPGLPRILGPGAGRFGSTELRLLHGLYRGVFYCRARLYGRNPGRAPLQAGAIVDTASNQPIGVVLTDPGKGYASPPVVTDSVGNATYTISMGQTTGTFPGCSDSIFPAAADVRRDNQLSGKPRDEHAWEVYELRHESDLARERLRNGLNLLDPEQHDRLDGSLSRPE